MKWFSFRRSSPSRAHRLAAAALLAALVACDGGSVEPLAPRLPAGSPSSTKTRIIGLVGSMSGPASWRGDDAFEGADLAVSDMNRTLRGNQPMYELVTLDDHGDPAEATRLVQQLAGSTRTVGVVYAGPTEGLPAAEQALAAAGIPAILCYGDLYGARALSPHVFQASPSYLWEARRIVAYLLGDRRYRRIGLISGTDLDGQTARRALTLALQENGAALTASATYEPGAADMDQTIEVMRKKRVQAIVVEAPPPEAERIFGALRLVGAGYQGTAAARASSRETRRWVPQVAGFDLVLSPRLDKAQPPAGTIAADTYARGAHYLPVPSFVRFRSRFEAWWGEAPLGWERRAYDAARMIGWAVDKAKRDPIEAELAATLQRMRSERFSGLDVTFGPDDHTAVDQTTVGLWVVPRPGIRVYERAALPGSMPWVPLGRGFSIDGETTDIASEDWRFLFQNAPPPKAPAPKIKRSLFGVTTPAGDPVH